MAITSAAAVIRHTAPHLVQMAHGEFTISFSNQCERNYLLDRPRWEVLFMWNQRRPKSRWIKSQFFHRSRWRPPPGSRKAPCASERVAQGRGDKVRGGRVGGAERECIAHGDVTADRHVSRHLEHAGAHKLPH